MPAAAPSVVIRHIFISPAHNFVGRHGQEPGDNPIQEVPSIECVEGRGVAGDRYFDHGDNFKGQITFFAWEVYEDLCRALGKQGIPPSVFRRNVITEGLDLSGLIGREFALQGIRFMGVEECKPCYWMDRAFAPGAEAALKGRGGLRARILSSGVLRAQPVVH